MAARRWPRKAQILRRHPELLGDPALRLLERDGGEVRSLHALLVRRARVVGVEPAVVQLRAAIEELPDLVAFGSAALRRYRSEGEAAELADAVIVLEAALDLAFPGFPDRPVVLANLGLVLRYRFEAGGAAADLRAALGVAEEAVALTAETAEVDQRRAALVNLASILLAGLWAGDAAAELSRAGDLAAAAAALPPGPDPEQASVLGVLGEVRLQNYRRSGSRSELDAAVTVQREAVGLGGARPLREWSNLGVALSERCLATGSLADLQEAVGLLTDAVGGTSMRDPDRPARLANLGAALLERARRRGDPRDLDAGLVALEEAAVAAAHEPDRSMWRFNLGLGLRDRYERDGDLADLDRAASLLEEVVTATPPGSALRPARLDQLAVTLRGQAQRRADPVQLARAVELHRSAASETVVETAERTALLGNLGGTLRAWARAGGGRDALDEALRHYRRALAGTVAGDAAHAAVLADLGNGLVDRFDLDGDVDLLTEAIAVYTAAVEQTDSRSPELPGRLHNRAGALRRRYDRAGRAEDRDAVLADYRAGALGAGGSVPEVALHCALSWADWAMQRESPEEAAEAFDAAAAAADRLLRRQLRRSDREVWLRAVGPMPVDSAFVLRRLGRTGAAVARMEWGRARLLADELARFQLTGLGRLVPDLTERYRAAAGRVAAASTSLERDGSGLRSVRAVAPGRRP